jgi:hypothetical protein
MTKPHPRRARRRRRESPGRNGATTNPVSQKITANSTPYATSAFVVNKVSSRSSRFRAKSIAEAMKPPLCEVTAAALATAASGVAAFVKANATAHSATRVASGTSFES